MRLAAQCIGGFYPVATEIVRLVAARLKYSCGPILDPCAGEGEALDTLAQALGAPRDMVYAVELERDRAETTRQRLEGAHVIGPASFFDLKLSARSIAVAWVNPPFDDNVKGGRAEVDFIMEATTALATAGVLCFVCPAHVVENLWKDAARTLVEEYEQLAILTPPEEHRPFHEVIVIGKRRAKSVPWDAEAWSKQVRRGLLAECQLTWDVPTVTTGPKTFEKGCYTDDEWVQVLEASPLWKLTNRPEKKPMARPPLPLGKGHVALLLASGQIDGVVAPKDEPPHVVRGTAIKVQCPPEVTEEQNPAGGLTTRTVIKERIQLVVRAALANGTIRTFS